MKEPLRSCNTDTLYASNRYVLRCCGLYIGRWLKDNGKTDIYIANLIGCSRVAISKLRRGLADRGSLSFLSVIAQAIDTDLITMILEGNGLLKEQDNVINV